MIEQKQNIKDWYPFDTCKTIGQTGSENGKIIDDIENFNGARISIEKDTNIAPYAVTLGIYGLLFHTHFADTENEAQKFVDEAKIRVEKLFEHLTVPDEQPDHLWNETYNKLKEQICEMD